MRLFKNKKNDLKEILKKEELTYEEYSRKCREIRGCIDYCDPLDYERDIYGSVQVGYRRIKEIFLLSRPEKNFEYRSGKKITWYEAKAVCGKHGIYNIYWTKINPEAENEGDACDWETYYVAIYDMHLYRDILEKLSRADTEYKVPKLKTKKGMNI